MSAPRPMTVGDLRRALADASIPDAAPVSLHVADADDDPGCDPVCSLREAAYDPPDARFASELAGHEGPPELFLRGSVAADDRDEREAEDAEQDRTAALAEARALVDAHDGKAKS